jgi:hypothetical protein
MIEEVTELANHLEKMRASEEEFLYWLSHCSETAWRGTYHQIGSRNLQLFISDTFRGNIEGYNPALFDSLVDIADACLGADDNDEEIQGEET